MLVLTARAFRRQFLEEGYAVIFLHRGGSKQPFVHRFAGMHLLRDVLELKDGGLSVQPSIIADVVAAHGKYTKALEGGCLLEVSFESVVDYLHLLRAATSAVAPIREAAVVYLAAAVSDYYLASAAMAVHKIQSSSGTLELSLSPVPKAVYPLVSQWCPGAFVVTFKLETDSAILEKKATGALEKYKHQLVVANLLHTRYEVVYLFSAGGNPATEVRGQPLDTHIVRAVCDHHKAFEGTLAT